MKKTPTIVGDKSLGARLHQWHAGQADPIYGVGSLFYADKPADRDDVAKAAKNLRGIRTEAGDEEPEAVELARELETLLGEAAGGSPSENIILIGDGVLVISGPRSAKEAKEAFLAAVNDYLSSPAGSERRDGDWFKGKFTVDDAVRHVPSETWARHGIASLRFQEAAEIPGDEDLRESVSEKEWGGLVEAVVLRMNGSLGFGGLKSATLVLSKGQVEESSTYVAARREAKGMSPAKIQDLIDKTKEDIKDAFDRHDSKTLYDLQARERGLIHELDESFGEALGVDVMRTVRVILAPAAEGADVSASVVRRQVSQNDQVVDRRLRRQIGSVTLANVKRVLGDQSRVDVTGTEDGLVIFWDKKASDAKELAAMVARIAREKSVPRDAPLAVVFPEQGEAFEREAVPVARMVKLNADRDKPNWAIVRKKLDVILSNPVAATPAAAAATPVAEGVAVASAADLSAHAARASRGLKGVSARSEDGARRVLVIANDLISTSIRMAEALDDSGATQDLADKVSGDQSVASWTSREGRSDVASETRLAREALASIRKLLSAPKLRDEDEADRLRAVVGSVESCLSKIDDAD